ncbi:MAG TPA: hypothetical protein VK130_02520 [Steroidobacteraceae bacterium]|nr:hypothetical protein [Steroidobacteraceae bacterium]
MKISWVALAMASVVPGLSLGCACGCGIFDVGTSAMYANHAGGMLFVEYDYLDQSHNYSGTSSAPAANNADKAIRSNFMTVGGQYQFNRIWGVSAELPYWQRYFQTTDENTGQIVAFNHGAVGDIRIKATYTGLSADMSSGLSLGLKLANGDSSYPNFDADTEIGSGSTDLLLGAYRLGRLSADNRWSYFLQGQWDQPVAHHDNYRPGAEVVAVFGAYFEGWALASGAKFSPVGQLRAVYRRPDGGADSLPNDTGYARVLVSPGAELAIGKFKLYADVAVPLYTNARGNQLFANEMWKLNASYRF